MAAAATVGSVDDHALLDLAVEEAQAGLREGGVPIGAALVGADGTVYLAGTTTGTFAGQVRNVAGVKREWWYHRSGCRTWFQAERDTRTNAVLRIGLPGELE